MTEKSKPNPSSNKQVNWPLILLSVLLAIVVLLIYIGYDYLNDDPAATASTLVESPIDKDNASISDDIVTQDLETGPKDQATKSKKTEKKKPIATEKPKSSITNSKETSSLEGTLITHEVKSGETFSSIRRRYNIPEKTLKLLNPVIKDQEKDVKAGITKLKIRVKAVHTVGPGDVFSKVAAKYGVKKELIMAANARTQDRTNRGEKLIIPLP